MLFLKSSIVLADIIKVMTHGTPQQLEQAMCESWQTWQTRFERWMERVDSEIYRRTELFSDDLPTIDYAVMFETGDNPATAASRAIGCLADSCGCRTF